MPVHKYALPVIFDGFTTQIDVDVSGYIADATQGIWRLYDIDFTEIVGVTAPINATTVRLVIEPAPAQGAYRLVGLQ